jgi:hypothetical protein
MATTTPNYGLRLPDDIGGVAGKGDLIDVTADIAASMSIIDTTMKDIDDDVIACRHVGLAPLDSGTITSTSFVATRTGGTNPTGVAFVVPDSGVVTIAWACGLLHSGASFTICSFEIRTGGTIGTGTVHTAATDSRAIQATGTNEVQAGRTSRITGLTPGNTFNVQLMYRTQAATATINRVEVEVMPSP